MPDIPAPESANAQLGSESAPAPDGLSDAVCDYSADPVFRAEKEHLSRTYATLQKMAGALTQKMRRNEDAAAATKRQMVEEIKPNFGSDTESFETYVDFATVNSVIDAYNQTQDSAAEKLSNIGLLLQQPYFAKVALQYKPGAPAKELYIGAAGVSDDDCRRLVVDWRSPVAEVYYNQDTGPTSYVANGRTIDVDLKLRRQFDIERDMLRGYFDTTVAIQDSLLLASLSRQRSEKMQAITATIQREQNQVIRHADCPVLLVAGIAGSGKTSVLLQRIAYLFYQQRGELRPQDVFLISPNPVFSRYIENVLPDLGERNPETITLSEFARTLLPVGQGAGKTPADIETLWAIDDAMAAGRFEFEPGDFRDIRVGNVKLITAGQVQQVRSKWPRIEPGARLANLMREELVKRLDSKLASLAASDDMYDEVISLSHDEQLAAFGEPVNPDDDAEVRRAALKLVRARYEDAYGMIARDEWLHVERVAKRLLGEGSLPAAAWLYLKMACTGLSNPDARYVMVDEVQDYSAAQLAVLARFFPNAHFMLLGDEHQAIREGGLTFAQVKDVFARLRGQVEECRLMTSYRSTPGITDLFARLLPESERMEVSSVQRDCSDPRVKAYADPAEWEEALRALVRQANAREEGLTAVIVPWKHEAHKLQALLGDDAPTLVSATGSLPHRGAVLLTLALAKGLEFDHVIIPNASAGLFPEGDRVAANRLYTTISRATRELDVLACGELTPLLS